MTDNWDNFETPQEKAQREREERSRDEFNQRDREETRRDIEREIERRNQQGRRDKRD